MGERIEVSDEMGERIEVPDDYVGQSFHSGWAARIVLVAHANGVHGALLRVGELSIDAVSRDVTLGERKLELSAKESPC